MVVHPIHETQTDRDPLAKLTRVLVRHRKRNDRSGVKPWQRLLNKVARSSKNKHARRPETLRITGRCTSIQGGNPAKIY